MDRATRVRVAGMVGWGDGSGASHCVRCRHQLDPPGRWEWTKGTGKGGKVRRDGEESAGGHSGGPTPEPRGPAVALTLPSESWLCTT